MIYAIHRKTKEHRVVPRFDVYSNHDWRYVEADADGWIKWDAKPGKECPVPADAYCDVKHEDGFIGDHVLAHSERWSGVGAPQGFRIVAYRPILDEPEAGEREWAIGERCIWQLGDVCMGEHVILAKDGDTYWIRDDHGGYDMADREELRPLRTPEDKAVEEMLPVICNNRLLGIDGAEARDIARALYRAGYRKTGGE